MTGHGPGIQGENCYRPPSHPKFLKGRSIPYFYREKVERELEWLVHEGTLEPVEYSDWPAPIVAADGEHHICGDF